MDDTQQLDRASLLEERIRLTNELDDSPYDLVLYLERAAIYEKLGYPDLAAGDAYKALILTDEAREESFEYHEQALEALQGHRSHKYLLADERAPLELEAGPEDEWNKLAEIASIQCYTILSRSLKQCGCLKSAYDFTSKGLALDPTNNTLLHIRSGIEEVARNRLGTSTFDISDLPDQGLARREIYPWNNHEPDRYAQSTIDNLNAELAICAPKCVVQAVSLPILWETARNKDDRETIKELEKDESLAMETAEANKAAIDASLDCACASMNATAEKASLENNKTKVPTMLQLGLFAKEDITAGEIVLNEYSLLTANNRLKASFCDACSTELPKLSSPLAKDIRTCEECSDIMFCNDFCYESAMEKYHPAVCDKDIDTIERDPDPKETPNALYLLLLARAMAMAATQEIHPLDLQELKFIWGDFIPSTELSSAVESAKTETGLPPISWTLPFSFKANIQTPLHVLEKMDIDIFQDLEFYDIWVLNTLYAKFRGTASARQSTAPGALGPEVAAVHPLWCLANHNCDPNVEWEWGGRMKFVAREKCVVGGVERKGIKKGEEILSHYCDVDLPVQERREWAKGSLGGLCMCERCRTEAGEV